ncbi:hypothetical protein IV203_020010 [Nitzschia inconspicua]|uniref:Uncharacterized protein n=1 Tax=Nitzschia inconspicua TaxID=303405 RepID=A0A9K3Q5T4_9STRA|nr:hypothetical protein IV203_020010 [Nitzschia inconspicua]
MQAVFTTGGKIAFLESTDMECQKSTIVGHESQDHCWGAAYYRRLRELQNNDDLPDNGSFDYALDVEIVPMEDGSSASITKFYYCASAASAGMAAALLI